MKAAFYFAVLLALPTAVPAADAGSYRAGVAKVDITPDHPVRLNGFGFRRMESEGVNQRIFARALALDTGDGAPAVLLAVDILGIPADIYDELARRLAKSGVTKERLAVTATHTHTAPMLRGANPTLFSTPIPPEHQANIDRYTPKFIDALETAAVTALKDLKSAKLSWGVGKATFAINRRKREVAPTDHDLPVLFVKDEAGTVRAIYLSYACHAVTLSHNQIGGDWPGYAAAAIEDNFAEAVALVAIGCGADQNPNSGVTGDKVDVAAAQGREIAAEVQRLAGQFLAPVTGKLTAKWQTLELPLADLPSREQWEENAKRMDGIGYHARVTLAKLDRGEALPTQVAYPVQTWTFGDSLAMVHLPGEVVVDYSRRLKAELDSRRLWVTAYANNNPCYIPSERVLKEGGYEAGGAMIYYDLPTVFRPGLEEKIISAVKEQLGPNFASTFDSQKTGGTRPLSPQQSLAAIRTKAGLQVDLVAAEPLVADPVAMAFGPDGKLWVAEMADYPTGRSGQFDPGGRVVFLEDTNGDGSFDSSTVFLDQLPFPTGVLPWRKGVLICAAPDILYAEDTTGDGKADTVEPLYSGFGTTNYQARVNSLEYGLDGWVYGSCGLHGGTITCHRNGNKVALGDRDFRIKPDSGELEPATGRSQQGRTRDDWGNWFGCDNSTLLLHSALEDHYLRRNPHVAAANSVVFVPTGADTNRMFPLKTDAQRFELSGPPGLVTAACGLGIYRDELLGSEFTGNAFTCETVNLAIHRRILQPKGVTFAGVRAPDEANSEFLATTDNWSRPVQAITGPDGGLWIADMYRYLIEHPTWIPPADLAQIDVRAGAGFGRIYRVRPAATALRSWPRLDQIDIAGLVAALDSPNGWQRDMAMQLLIWRGDAAAADALEKLLATSSRPLARLHALCTLDGLGLLRKDHIAAALTDSEPGVRRHAVRLAEPYLATDMVLAEAVAKLAADPHPPVRLQVAYALGAWPARQAAELLVKLARESARDSLMTSAIMSSLTAEHLPIFATLITSTGRDEPSAQLLRDLFASAAGLDGGRSLPGLIDNVIKPADGRFQPWQLAAAVGALDSLRSQGLDWTALPTDIRAALAPTVEFARRLVEDDNASQADLLAALPLLGRDPAERAADVKRLIALLVPSRPARVQSATVAALGRLATPDVPTALLTAWPEASPVLRTHIISVLFGRPAWHPQLLDALEDGTIPPGQIEAPIRFRLLHLADAATRARAEKLFTAANPDRQKVIADYESALALPGDQSRGKEVFAKICASCHALNGVGVAVGPDLTTLGNKSARYLLGEILDPNRNLDSRYVEYHATLKDGRLITGILAAETATGITLRGPEGKDETILRTDLERLLGTAKSLMPEGLEKDLSPQAVADLLAYLAVATVPQAAADDEPAEMAKAILDDATPRNRREALAREAAPQAAAVIKAMTTDLPADSKEEYRRIPWIWRVSVAAGRKNDTNVLRDLLDVSLPKLDEPLKDWQAVVIGGGVINGVSLENVWPGRRMNELLENRPELANRWESALKKSFTMADDEQVPHPTRYDALRMIPLADWKEAEPALTKYLAKNAHAELQMGAVSGLADVERKEVGPILVNALPDLTAANRKLAISGLLRTPERAAALLDGLEGGTVKPEWLDKQQRERLLKHEDEAIRMRAAKIIQ
jgi:putative membrane-bound dehydrogenase-like protein